ncbi:MAG: CBS domain-containing protein [Planctomycetes bacterium]|nr:CBS domain-containing protein [Planctomycetota bacterium]
MLVRDWMTPDPQTVSEADTLAEVREVMNRWRCRHLPVMSGERLVGIVTRSDVLSKTPDIREVTPDRFRHIMTNTPVAEIMTRDPVTVAAGDTVEKAMEHMVSKKLSGIPVVDNGRLAGIITETDCFRMFVEILGVNSGHPRISYDNLAPGNGALQTVLASLDHKGFEVTNLVCFHDSDHGRCAVIRGRGREGSRPSLRPQDG